MQFPYCKSVIDEDAHALKDKSPGYSNIAAPLRTLRAPSAHSHLLRGPAYVVQLPQNLIFRSSLGKKILIFAFFRPFRVPDGVNKVAKTASILGPLVAIGRGRNLPYFGKQNDIRVYFPHEQKIVIFRGFLAGVRI